MKYFISILLLLCPYYVFATQTGGSQPAAQLGAPQPVIAQAQPIQVQHAAAVAPPTDSMLSPSQQLYGQIAPHIAEYIRLKNRVTEIMGPNGNGQAILAIDPLTALSAVNTAVETGKSLVDMLSAPFSLLANKMFESNNFSGYAKEKKLITYISAVVKDFTGKAISKPSFANPLPAHFWSDEATSYWRTPQMSEDKTLELSGKARTGENLWLKVSKIFVRTRKDPQTDFVIYLLANAGIANQQLLGIEYFIVPIFQQMDLLMQDRKYSRERKARFN